MKQNSDDKKLSKSIEAWKAKLLDTSKRNKSINYRDTKLSSLSFIHPSFSSFISSDVSTYKIATPFDNNEESFDENEDDKTNSEEYIKCNKKNIKRKNVYSLVDLLPCIEDTKDYKDEKVLFTTYDGIDQKRALRTLLNRSKSFYEEYAINVLFLSVGILEWYENDEENECLRSPLLFIPVILNQDSFKSPYVLKIEKDDYSINDSLVYRLKTDFNLDINYVEDSANLETFYNNYKKLIKEKLGKNYKRWKIEDELHLSIFSFSKISMIKDIEKNDDRIRNNSFLREISGCELFEENKDLLVNDKDVDKEISEEENYHVLDADSSQEAAIQSAIKGNSFILQGPPGTGKSQTITNIISELISRGKKVLFVAEKKAALDVVYNNLKKCNMAQYSFPIHNIKLNKKEVIDDLSSTLNRADELPLINNSEYQKNIKAFEKSRDYLSEYGDFLNKKIQPLDETIYNIFGYFIKYDSDESLKEDLKFDIKNIDSLTFSDLVEYESAFKCFEKSFKEIAYDELLSPFYGYKDEDASRSKIEKLTKAQEEYKKSLESKDLNFVKELGINLSSSFFDKMIDATKMILDSISKSDTKFDTRFFTCKDILKEEKSYSSLLPLIKYKEEKINMLLKEYEEDILSSNIDSYIQSIYKYGGVISHIFSSEYKEIKNKILRYKKSKSISYKDMLFVVESLDSLKSSEKKILSAYKKCEVKLDELNSSSVNESLKNITWTKSFNELLLSEGSKKDSLFTTSIEDFINLYFENKKENDKSIKGFTSWYRVYKERKEALQEFFIVRKRNLSIYSLKDLIKIIDNQLNNMNLLSSYADFNRDSSKLDKLGLEEIKNLIISKKIEGRYNDYFLKRYYSLLVEKILEEEKVSYSGNELQNNRETYCQSNEVLNKYSKLLSEEKLHSYMPSLHSASIINADAKFLISEANKSRNIISIRKLFKKIPDLILSLKPCLMMSPLSVSTYLKDSSLNFDVVIFDEASQMKPENSIGAILRTKQLIISGDSEQLPPTNFFQSIEKEEGYNEEDEETSDYDSILDAAQKVIKKISLKWHYRSKFEELIKPSNKFIYNDTLVTFPSISKPTKYEGVVYDYVRSATYSSRQNILEAEEVVNKIKELVNLYGRNKSIGIVTFNEKQQRLISQRCRKLLRENENYSFLISEDNPSPLFVKNIETVQGDERDIIIISTTFGRNENGKVNQNFGPINGSDGYRRLNVAFTRAKEALILVTSLVPDDIEVQSTSSKGIKFFKQYLSYASSKDNSLSSAFGKNKDESQPFEEDVEEELTKRNYIVDRQVGCSTYRISLGVKKNKTDSKYSIGIECDGQAYSSSCASKDRDILREQVLKSRGWNIYRIWSLDWINNKDREINNLISYIDSHLKETPIEKEEKKEKSKKSLFDVEYVERTQTIDFESYPSYDSFDNETYFNLYDLLKIIIKATYPICKDELKKVKEICASCGRSIFNEAVEKSLDFALKNLISSKIVINKHGFYYYCGEGITFKKYGKNSSKRPFDNISDDELRDGLLRYIKAVKKVNEDDLYQCIIKECGYSSLSTSMRFTLNQIVNSLIEEGIVVEISNNICII